MTDTQINSIAQRIKTAEDEATRLDHIQGAYRSLIDDLLQFADSMVTQINSVEQQSFAEGWLNGVRRRVEEADKR